MQIVVIDKQKLLSQNALAKVESKANAAFAKFGFNIRSIDITVQDINGPRGGVDNECRVVIKLRKMKDIVVAVKDESISKAISNAINRSARSVNRSLDRRVMRDGNRLTRFGFEI